MCGFVTDSAVLPRHSDFEGWDMMILIAIASDDQQDGQALEKCVERCLVQKNAVYTIRRFSSGAELVRSRTVYDLVFLDAKLSDMDGLQAAHFLHIISKDTMLIFVTDMVQLAVQGYGVGAFDFVTPPADQAAVSRVMDRAWVKLEERKRDYLTIKTRDELIYLPVYSIYYVEVNDHRLVYHTARGDHRACERFRDARERLGSRSFVQCSRSFLVNLSHIQSLHSDYLMVNGVRIRVAKKHHKELRRIICDYLEASVSFS